VTDFLPCKLHQQATAPWSWCDQCYKGQILENTCSEGNCYHREKGRTET
jgi:hypothetical protein